ncbi:MAG TPA: hypothetical protein ENF47_03080 [Thermoprotei archaeon]|nr:hypothetical protein [Thermoprotei archaeon]
MSKSNMIYLEGDFIEDYNGIIYDVKGFEHPPNKVVAYPRYIPDPKGDRRRGNIRYRKIYDLNERYEFLRKRLKKYIVYDPIFDTNIPEIPVEDLLRHYNPRETLLKLLSESRSLNRVLSDIISLVNYIIEYSGISYDNIGLSGSYMVDLYRPDSDIDLIIYGDETSKAVIKGLYEMYEDSVIRRYSLDELHSLYRFRKAYKISFEEFKYIESRKPFQGIFHNKEFYIRFLRSLEKYHKYGYLKYHNLGRLHITAYVTDDSESIYTPCKYRVEVLSSNPSYEIDLKKPFYVVSFRGRYTYSAFKGECIEAEGKLEEVYRDDEVIQYRLLLGESYSDYLRIVRYNEYQSHNI